MSLRAFNTDSTDYRVRCTSVKPKPQCKGSFDNVVATASDNTVRDIRKFLVPTNQPVPTSNNLPASEISKNHNYILNLVDEDMAMAANVQNLILLPATGVRRGQTLNLQLKADTSVAAASVHIGLYDAIGQPYSDIGAMGVSALYTIDLNPAFNITDMTINGGNTGFANNTDTLVGTMTGPANLFIQLVAETNKNLNPNIPGFTNTVTDVFWIVTGGNDLQ